MNSAFAPLWSLKGSALVFVIILYLDYSRVLILQANFKAHLLLGQSLPFSAIPPARNKGPIVLFNVARDGGGGPRKNVLLARRRVNRGIRRLCSFLSECRNFREPHARSGGPISISRTVKRQFCVIVSQDRAVFLEIGFEVCDSLSNSCHISTERMYEVVRLRRC